MTTLISSYGAGGERRCDSKCYNAKGPDCDCICGGRNHGVGFLKAVDNTRQFAEAMVSEWMARHPETDGFDLSVAQQIALPL